MPKTPIDYSKACVYRLVHNHITYYVGSTTNMRLRKSQHKHNCNIENNEHYNLKLCQFIRENGGWENWSMILVEEYPNCKSPDELRMYERHHYDIYRPSINTKKPHASIEERKEYLREYMIEKDKDKISCVCGGRYDYRHKARHLKTSKHMRYIREYNSADV